MMGGGVDSFAYRRGAVSERLKVCEVAQAASQAWKHRRREEMGVAIPPSVAFVPLDAEVDDLVQALTGAGFDISVPAIVSAIALTQYLAQPAIERILYLVASFAPGSRMVLTYVVPATELSEMAAAGLAWTMSQAAERGESFLSLSLQFAFPALLHPTHFARLQVVGPLQLIQRYLADRPGAQLTGI